MMPFLKQRARRPGGAACTVLFLLFSALLLSACGTDAENSSQGPESSTARASNGTPVMVDPTPTAPLLDLSIDEADVTLAPLPLRAGSPFTITTVIHNLSDIPAPDVPLMVHISAMREELGYASFLQTLTVTVPATQSIPVAVPVDWNLSGGEHRLWIQVNRLPEAWQSRLTIIPESDVGNNMVSLDLMVDPFDAYVSDLCPGRLDMEVGPQDVIPQPDEQGVLVRVHNVGNQAVYNVPVIALGDQISGVAYTPAIPPCGGTAQVNVALDHAFAEGEALTILINPQEWENGLAEDNRDNNQVTVSAGLPADAVQQATGLQDYDFHIETADIEIPQMWIVLIRVHNLGTRDAADVPFRIENEAGRKLTDVVPLVQGNGLGLAALPVGYLWTSGGTLTFTVNPADAKNAYPESNRDDNVATFTLP